MTSETISRTVAVGVGIDTARYGHHATFLREDRQAAAKPMQFLESRSGYQQLENVLGQLASKHAHVHFHIHVDAAGQYASNLLKFLGGLSWPTTLSVGNPARNEQYRRVHFPKRKADATESHACARFAIVERPAPWSPAPPEMQALREVASRLEFQVKQSTRQVNRLHNLMARVFPELALLQNNFQSHGILLLLDKYPTAERLAKAREESIIAIPYLAKDKARQLHAAAKQSVASERGPIIEKLVRQAVRELRQAIQAEAKAEKLLLEAFEGIPDEKAKRIRTIPGIGPRTTAVLVAKIVCIQRFPSADHLTGYFGIFPEESTSGVDRAGRSLPAGTRRMSRKGNDLVRKYLWMAAFSAIKHNPPVKALYARLRKRGRRGDVALGHCMRKLLHQVFGIWTTGRDFDADYAQAAKKEDTPVQETTSVETQGKAAGRTTGISPNRKSVTATSGNVGSNAPTVKEDVTPIESVSNATTNSGFADFAQLRSQITLERVLRHIGYFDRLRGGGVQRRGPCPVHGSKRDRGRTFSVHLGKNVFQCFHPPCGSAGNVLDLWCAIHHLTLYEGAVHLAETFALDLQ